MAQATETVAPLVWYSPKEKPFQLAGFAWFEQERIYRRLPTKPRWPLPPAVDALADNTAGGQIRFRTDSGRLSLRVRLKAPPNMNHMPATGQCGFDCYLGTIGQQRYIATARPELGKCDYERVLFDLPKGEMRHVTLNFPLYQGVEEVLVGLDAEARLLPPWPYSRERRVVIYGTSITQGGCASRPGMAYTNILSRRIPIEFINLGFSGSGRGEPEVAHVIAEIPNPACLVLDYEANSQGIESLRKTFPEFIRILREAHPDVPILAISRILPASVNFKDEVRAGIEERREFQRQTVESLRARGDGHLHFLDGGELLGDDFDECTVDGSHPTDLGFLRMADALTPVLRGLLFGGSHDG